MSRLSGPPGGTPSPGVATSGRRSGQATTAPASAVPLGRMVPARRTRQALPL
ncbi:MAG: hypothetical protein MUC94_06515 [bacterium]|nr:hypothetical protein [bacterium]